MLTAVQSSNIKAVGWDADVLTVAFSSGSVYRYKGVTREQDDALLASESKGRFVRTLIVGRYPAEKLAPAEALAAVGLEARHV